MDAARAWDALEPPWRVCLSLAWEAYGAGTIPVGAALVDGTGAIVAEGRDRLLDAGAPETAAAGVPLAEALPDVWPVLSASVASAATRRARP
jgi:tRNA(adenine34) deaminase